MFSLFIACPNIYILTFIVVIHKNDFSVLELKPFHHCFIRNVYFFFFVFHDPFYHFLASQHRIYFLNCKVNYMSFSNICHRIQVMINCRLSSSCSLFGVFLVLNETFVP